MEQHKNRLCVLGEHRDAAVTIATRHVPGIRHRVQHSRRIAGRSSVHWHKESSRKTVKIRIDVIYWGKRALTLGPRETVALAALIVTHLYAVSSRQHK